MKSLIKSLILFSNIIALILPFCVYAQDYYFGQDPPGKVPKVFAPEYVSIDNQGEEKLTISDDGKEIYWNIHPMDYSYFRIKYSIYNMENSTWSSPAFLFDGYYAHPILTPDNTMLVVLNGNIYKSFRTGEGWTKPVIIDSTIFANYNIGPIAITSDTTLCFIDITRPEHDIYLSEYLNGHFQLPEKLPFPINYDNYMVNNPFIGRDGSYLLFSIRNFPDSYGYGDIYVSYKKDDNTWTYPKNLGQNINKPTADYGVYVSPDEKYLFYTRWEFNNDVNIHWCNIEGLLDSLKNTNCLPYMAHLIADQVCTVGDSFHYSIPDTIFIDDDGNETITLSAKLSNGDELPEWLDFNPLTQTFSGTPAEAGYINIKVIATDTEGVSVSDIFKLTIEETVGIEETNNDRVQTSFSLGQNYPNPFNPSTTIKYNLDRSNNVMLTVYNISGQKVDTLVNGYQSAGEHKITWRSKGLSSGIYFCRLQAGKFSETIKLLLQK